MKSMTIKLFNYFTFLSIFLLSFVWIYLYVLMVDETPARISFNEFIFFALFTFIIFALQLLFNLKNSPKSTILVFNSALVTLTMIFWIRALIDMIEYSRYGLYPTTCVLIGLLTMLIIFSIFIKRYRRKGECYEKN